MDGAGAVGRWLRDEGGALVASMEHYASRFTYPASMLDASLTAWRAWQRARRASERPCTAPTEPIPPTSNRRVAVLVAGVGSNSEGSTIDEVRTAELGYARADVVRFSYAGGRVPDPTDGFPSLPTTRYDASAHPGRPPWHRGPARRSRGGDGGRGPRRVDRPDRALARRAGRPLGADRARAPPRGRVARSDRAGGHARDAARRGRPRHGDPRALEHPLRCHRPRRRDRGHRPGARPRRSVRGAAERDLEPRRGAGRSPGARRRRCDLHRRPRRPDRARAAKRGARHGRGHRAAGRRGGAQRPAGQRCRDA